MIAVSCFSIRVSLSSPRLEVFKDCVERIYHETCRRYRCSRLKPLLVISSGKCVMLMRPALLEADKLSTLRPPGGLAPLLYIDIACRDPNDLADITDYLSSLSNREECRDIVWRTID
ncbi:MAG: hypothetical protein ABWW69_06600 [Pyrodictiaceae archaeon]